MSAPSPARTSTPVRAGSRLRSGNRLARLLPADATLQLLAMVTLVNTFGNGLFVTTAALFFTRSVGLTPGEVGVGLAVAGGCGIAAGPPLGWAADRLGARRTLVALLVLDGLGTLGYLEIHSFPAFMALASAVTFVDRGGSAVRGALLAGALPASDRVRGRAYLRAVTNVGIGAGAALAAVALQSDTRSAYLAIVAANAVTFGVAALLLLRLRPAPATAAPPAGRTKAPTRAEEEPSLAAAEPAPAAPPARRALTDVRYLLVTALNAVLALQFGVMEIGLPLWVVRSTSAPRWVISAVFVMNTAMVVLLQVRFSRGTEDLSRAARACGRGGMLLAAACAVYGLAAGLPPAAAVAVLAAGGVIQTIGEMLSSAGGWSLSYGLADPAAHGVYQGVFNSGFTAGSQFSALVVTATAIRFGLAGWVALGAVFVAAGLALIPATRWAGRRPRLPGARSPAAAR